MRLRTIILQLSLAAQVFGDSWRPVDPAELTLKQPRIQSDADAEAIFWEVAIEDKFTSDGLELAFNHYVRLKIFTERGVKEYATVEIPQIGKRYVSSISGRTLKPGGAIVELRKDAIFDRNLVKTKGFKAKGKSFALPQVEPGDIIEYQYREVHSNASSNYLHLQFQREMPVWRATYQLKPLQFPGEISQIAMRSLPFNIPPLRFERSKTRAGFAEASVENIPAFKTESYMPPDEQVRGWMLIYYEEDRKLEAEKFWKSIGKSAYDAARDVTKADGSVKKLAEELTAGRADADAKLAAIEEYCRTKIRNINWSGSGITAEERNAFKRNLNPSATLKQKTGTGDDIRYLFVALAQAAGIDARIALVPDRGQHFFTPQRMTRAFLQNESVAVKSGDQWKFYDPGTPLLPPKSVRWQEEALAALITDPKDPLFVVAPVTPAADSVRQRRGQFKLLDDGTLEGTIRFQYTGHPGVEQKNLLDDLSENERIEHWKESLTARLSTAEVSDLKIENALDAVKPITISCKISVPGYATRTGKRLLVQPAFFQRNIEAMFQPAAREHDIYFRYGWKEDDEVIIDLPEGWALDQPFAPQGFNVNNFGSYSVNLLKNGDGTRLIYRRAFLWGITPNFNGLLVPKTAYTQLKTVFDTIHEQDNHVVTLKPTPGAAQ